MIDRNAIENLVGALVMKHNRRWYLYGLIGLIFGMIDWFYLDWLAFGLGQNLPENPIIVIPIIVGLNYGIWLVPIIPVTIYESQRADSIKGPIKAGILTWVCALLSYYAFYAVLFSLGKLPNLEWFNIFGARFDGFWWQYWQWIRRIILLQLLEWLPIGLIGGGTIGSLAWWTTRKRK